MKKSKHFRKDVIIARIIFAVLCITIGILIGSGISALVKSTGNNENKNTEQRTESQQTENLENQQTESIDPEPEVEVETEEEPQTILYVIPSTEVRVRKEPNTTCEILDRIPAGTKTIFIEELDGWYKVEHNGQEGYISADYAEVVEETVSAE